MILAFLCSVAFKTRDNQINMQNDDPGPHQSRWFNPHREQPEECIVAQTPRS